VGTKWWLSEWPCPRKWQTRSQLFLNVPPLMLDCKSANKSQPWAPATLHLGNVGGAAAAAEATTFPRVSQKGNWQQRQPQQKQEQQTNSTNKTAATVLLLLLGKKPFPSRRATDARQAFAATTTLNLSMHSEPLWFRNGAGPGGHLVCKVNYPVRQFQRCILVSILREEHIQEGLRAAPVAANTKLPT